MPSGSNSYLGHVKYLIMGPIKSAAYWKEKLQLESHVEGGSFREIYRAGLILQRGTLTPEHNDSRSASTAIYFLLERGDFSAFHRIASDELWHFYYGDTLTIYEIDQNGILTRHLLGNDVEHGAMPVVCIKAGSWFGSLVGEGTYTLCGCTVAPGFDFNDFELAERAVLTASYPQHKVVIDKLTR
jgi:predicted cupin superfamily sugar epimerase